MSRYIVLTLICAWTAGLVTGCATQEALDRLENSQMELQVKQSLLAQTSDPQRVRALQEDIRVLEAVVREQKSQVSRERHQSARKGVTLAASATEGIGGLLGMFWPGAGAAGVTISSILRAILKKGATA